MIKKLLLAGLVVAPMMAHADDVYLMFEGVVTQVRDNTETHALHDYHVGRSVRYQIKVDPAARGWWFGTDQNHYPANSASEFYSRADLAVGVCSTMADARYLDWDHHLLIQENRNGKPSTRIMVGSLLSISAASSWPQFREGMSFKGEQLAHKIHGNEANSFIRSDLKLTMISPRIIPCG